MCIKVYVCVWCVVRGVVMVVMIIMVMVMGMVDVGEMVRMVL